MGEARVSLSGGSKKTREDRGPHSFEIPLEILPDYEKQQIELEKSYQDRPFRFLTEAMCGGTDLIVDPQRGDVRARLKELRWLERSGAGIWRPKIVRGVNAWDYLQEATRKVKKAMRRSRESWSGNDWDSARSGVGGEFLPIPPGPYTRQLYLYDFWKMVAQCFEAYNHNPIAKGIVAIRSAFTVGQGIRLTCVGKKTQEFMDEWMQEFDLNPRLSTWADMLSLNGELATEPWKVRPGYLNFVNIDPPTIWEFITNPRNINQVFGIWMQYSTQTQIKTDRYGGGQERTMDYVIELLPPDRVIHTKINVHENEKRGRSDLLPILGWLRFFKDFYYNKVVRAVGEAAFMLDHEVDGNKADIARVAAKYKSWPKPGTRFVHSKAEKLTVAGFQGAAAQRSSIGDELLNIICVGAGVPKEYLGLGDLGSRATAVVATDPFAKLIQIRRQKIEGHLKKMFKLVIKEAKREGIIPQDEDEAVETSWDELSPESTKDKIDILALLEEKGVISHKRFATLSTQEVDLTDYDYDQEQTDIEQDRQDDLENMIPFGDGTVGPEGDKVDPEGEPTPRRGLFKKPPAEKTMSNSNQQKTKKSLRSR